MQLCAKVEKESFVSTLPSMGQDWGPFLGGGGRFTKPPVLEGISQGPGEGSAPQT